MTADFDRLTNFDFSNSSVQLWVFKDSTTDRRFRAFYAQMDDDLNQQLKNIVQTNVSRITEFDTYSYISQTNENSCLTIDKGETDFPNLLSITPSMTRPKHGFT